MNEFGQPSIDEIFHPLRTRLYKLENSNVEHEDGIYDGIEDYCSRKIQPILTGIFAFDSKVSLKFIDNILTSIEQLEASASDIVKNVTGDYWGFNSDVVISSGNNAKKEALRDIQSELAYYKDNLTKLKAQLLNNFSEDRKIETRTREEIELPEDFNLPKVKSGSKVGFDKYQSAILFHYLKETGAIRMISDSSLSKIVSFLTGHSEQNIRQDGFGKIWDVLKDKEKNKSITEPNHNLIIVKNLLEGITLQLDSQIKLNNSSKL